MRKTDDETHHSPRITRNERFARHLVLEEIGLRGQKAIEAGSVNLAGDPAITEPAAELLRAAGVGEVGMAADGNSRAERASAEFGASRCEVFANGEVIGFSSESSSRSASRVELRAAGLMLAGEILLGLASGRERQPWNILLE